MNTKIIGIGVSYPDNIVTNDYYINHFKKQGKDISAMMEAFGRNERRVINNKHDNTITLGIKAALNALKSANLTGKDIDLIMFSSQFPEYTCPSQALILHNGIHGKDDAIVMDTNINCIGMLESIDTASRYLIQKKRAKRALVVGSDYMTANCKESDEITYPIFGDCGCAVIIEKSEEDCGIIDSVYQTNSDDFFMVKFPGCGTSKSYGENDDNRKLKWRKFDGNHIVGHATYSVNKLLEYNNLDISQIKCFCISQYSLSLLKGCSESFGVPLDKFIYVGDKYGYTGTSSPFLAFYEGIKSGNIKRGDYIIFWSVAIQWTTCALLVKY